MVIQGITTSYERKNVDVGLSREWKHGGMYKVKASGLELPVTR